MNFLLECVTCSGSCSSETLRPAADETGLLVVQEPRRRVGRKKGRSKSGGGGREWRPSLSSISEDVLMAERRNISHVERDPAAESGWRRSLKTKVSAISQRERSRSFDHDDGR
ncbi:hypothetical protein PHJA_001140000 [Phtheirospermum japonicum]|uniref:Uncharacterized protein n=1 Tax=Phtheirospermum japonicum TaxID=374723 RepID=A0A830BVC7_9LAMI|nr:hypothetical protein PHJA_001140000 [Phtheirospermum japonicum]